MVVEILLPSSVNLLAVVVAAIASMVIGMLWYGPIFGKQWIAHMGIKTKDMASMKKGAGKKSAQGFISTLVMSYVLAHFIAFTQAATIAEGAVIGFWLWLGFVATVTAGSVIWERRSKDLYFLNNAYQLVSLAVMGAILAVL